jgi:hypothetical protein
MSDHNGALPQQVKSRAYYFMGDPSPDEAVGLQMIGLDPEDYTVLLCPAMAPPQPTRPLQQVVVNDPVSGAPYGTAVVMLVPIAVPLAVPKIVGGLMGPDGKPIGGGARMEGPPMAVARIVVPLKSLTYESLQERAEAMAQAAEAMAQAAVEAKSADVDAPHESRVYVPTGEVPEAK